MKKYFLLLGAMLLSALSFAQTRQYMGAYTSDNYSAEGLGLTNNTSTFSIVADIYPELIGVYDGGKVVGMRFALAEDCIVTKCFILNYVSSNQIDTLASANVSNAKKGWNEVMFGKPFTLNVSTIGDLLMGYTYTQTSTNSPIAYAAEGEACGTYVYGNLGQGIGYYDIGMEDYGNLSVQAIVEKNYDKYSVAVSDFETVYTTIGNAKDVELSLQNTGTESVSSISYVLTQGGKSDAEKQINVTPVISQFGKKFTVNVPLNVTSQLCTQDVTITITKVDGKANESAANKANGQITTVKKLFKHRVAVEEYTGTGCGWCPRGMQGMENLRSKFGDSFIGIAIHQYSTNSRDAMYISSSNYKHVKFEGAPSCRIERGSEMDPFYGTGASICNDFESVLKQVAPVGVEVAGAWSSDKKTVKAGATVEALFDGNAYDIEYVLVADGLKGNSTTWKQSNYYYQYTQAQVDDDLKQFASGGKYGTSAFSGWEFNDVAIASSFVNSANKAKTLGVLSAYTPVESECTLSMPTGAILLNAIKYDQVYIVALVVDKETGKIVNAAKSAIGDETAIEDIVTDEPMTRPTATYNLSGQRVQSGYKGIVIKNGRKYVENR